MTVGVAVGTTVALVEPTLTAVGGAGGTLELAATTLGTRGAVTGVDPGVVDATSVAVMPDPPGVATFGVAGTTVGGDPPPQAASASAPARMETTN